MIHSKDRSGWFGASDTEYVIGNWNTKTFRKWWAVKLGITTNNFNTIYTAAGNNYEGKILDALGFPVHKDTQVIVPLIRLRVNLDGNTCDTDYEAKTYKAANGYKVPKAHYHQVQVQMYATGYRKAVILAYPLEDQEYKNFFTHIDPDKIQWHSVSYDRDFIELIYLPRIRILARCLIERRFPTLEINNTA